VGVAVVYFSAVVCLYAVNFWMPTIVQELSAGASFARLGLLTGVPWCAAAISMVVFARHSDRTGERRWHVAGGLLGASAGLLLLAGTEASAIVSFGALTLICAGLLSTLSTFWSIATAMFSGTAAAAGIAWINAVGNLGGHVGPDLIGRLRTISGGSGDIAFAMLAAFAGVGATIVLVLPRADAP
jgi:MFS family permease